MYDVDDFGEVVGDVCEILCEDVDFVVVVVYLDVGVVEFVFYGGGVCDFECCGWGCGGCS